MLDLNVDSIITDNPYLIESAIYWKKMDLLVKCQIIYFKYSIIVLSSKRDIIKINNISFNINKFVKLRLFL